MNYRKHYDALIARAKLRAFSGYTERHHIVPRCVGGGDDNKNLVEITPEEHFLAHKLLVHLYPGHLGLLTALMLMSRNPDGGPRQNNKLFGWVRRKLSKRRTGMKSTDAMKAAVSRAQKGRKRSPEWVAEMAARNKGRKKTEDEIRRITEGVSVTCRTPEFRAMVSANNKGRIHSDESRENMRRAHLGKVTSEITKAKLSAAAKGRMATDAAKANMKAAAIRREAAKRASVAAE